MAPHPSSSRRPLLTLTVALLTITLLAITPALPAPPASASADVVPTPTGWTWPVHPFRVVEHFVAPAHAYGPGHRGVDLEPASPDAPVGSPAVGVVAFAGPVAGRGVVTIDHGDGLVTTLEPVDPEVAPGTPVVAGQRVGSLGIGGHTHTGALHVGVRWHGEYINPLLLLGEVPRAVLLPCCEPIATAQPMVLRSPASSMRSMPVSARMMLSSPSTETASMPPAARTVLRSPDTATSATRSRSTTVS